MNDPSNCTFYVGFDKRLFNMYYLPNDRGLSMHRFDKLGPKRSMNQIKYGDEAGNGVLSLVLSLELVDYATEICPNGKGNHIRS